MRDEGVTTLTGKDKIKVSGRAMIIQDIAAPPSFCIEKMLDFDNYTKMVSLLKKFDIYEKTKLNNVSIEPHIHPKDSACLSQLLGLISNLPTIYMMKQGTEITCAKYEVGLFYLRLGYFLKQKYSPQYNSLTWTLDYSRDSDFGTALFRLRAAFLLPHFNSSTVIFSILKQKLLLFVCGCVDDNVGHWQVMSHPHKM